MLVLSRKIDESIQIGDDVTITVIKVKGNTVRLGISAPADVRVMRGELQTGHFEVEVSLDAGDDTSRESTADSEPSRFDRDDSDQAIAILETRSDRPTRFRTETLEERDSGAAGRKSTGDCRTTAAVDALSRLRAKARDGISQAPESDQTELQNGCDAFLSFPNSPCSTNS